MKYTNHLKKWRIVITAVMFVFIIGAVGSVCGELISSFRTHKTDSLTIVIMLVLMMAVFSFVAYRWLTTVMEIELSGEVVTLTFITNKKMTVSVYEVMRIKEDSRGYLIRIGRKDYYVSGKFNTASGKYESISFIIPAYFPNAVFVKGMF